MSKLSEYYKKKKAEFNKFQEKKRAEFNQKQASDIKKLKEIRQREEGSAKLRKIKVKEQSRITKARSQGYTKKKVSSASGGSMDFGFGGSSGGSMDFGVGGSSGGSMDFGVGGGSSKSNNMFDMGFGSSTKRKVKRRTKRKVKRKVKRRTKRKTKPSQKSGNNFDMGF